MKLVVDALAASYGGIATYAENVLRAWRITFPDDELHVLLPTGSSWWEVPDGVVRHDLRLGGLGKPARAALVTRELPRIVAAVGADAVIAANPATTLRPLRGVPLGVVAHDLRHELRPDQFPLVRRTVRRWSHRRGYRTADVVLAISQRTADDVARACPDVADRTTVVHLGADHVRRWAGENHLGSAAVASCHHSNKDVGMLLRAWQLLGADAPPLDLLGLSGRRAAPVRAMVRDLALGERVTIRPFLPDHDFQRTVTGARLVLFVSDFEGFGLPVAEAMQLRKPVVIGPEPACLEIAAGHATVLRDWTAGAAADAVRSALHRTPADLESAGAFADRYTWAATAAGVRTALLAAG